MKTLGVIKASMSKAFFMLHLLFAFVGSSLEFVQAEQPPQAEEKRKDFLLGSFKPDEGQNKQPIFIQSVSLRLDTKKRVFSYSGNVEVRQGDLHVTGEYMTGFYNEASEIEQIVMERSVVITKGKEMRATSERAEYDVNQATIVLSQAPELLREGNILSADKIILFLDEERSEAEGNVRVKLLPEAAKENHDS